MYHHRHSIKVLHTRTDHNSPLSQASIASTLLPLSQIDTCCLGAPALVRARAGGFNVVVALLEECVGPIGPNIADLCSVPGFCKHCSWDKCACSICVVEGLGWRLSNVAGTIQCVRREGCDSESSEDEVKIGLHDDCAKVW